MTDLFILGATGSIGTQTLDIVRNFKDKFRVVGLSLGRDLLRSQAIIDEFKPEIVCLRHKEDLDIIKTSATMVYGDDGLLEIAKYKSSNDAIFINALVGSAGLKPTVLAIKSKKNIALANKETLVMAGDIIKSLVKEYNVFLHPIDSEHSAIWQVLRGEEHNDIKSLIITASGGSFRDKKREELENVTVSDALNHPNWQMGAKITIDSATMMNKGFEVIEAHYLFDIPYENIETIIHPESIVHSLVRFKDGVIKASLGVTDMRIPILYALSYPNHYDTNSNFDLDLAGLNLSFRKMDLNRFKMLDYAYQAARLGKFHLVALNAANEAAVKLFLEDKIKFLEIEDIVYQYINKDYSNYEYNIDEIIRVDRLIQEEIYRIYGGIK